MYSVYILVYIICYYIKYILFITVYYITYIIPWNAVFFIFFIYYFFYVGQENIGRIVFYIMTVQYTVRKKKNPSKFTVKRWNCTQKIQQQHFKFCRLYSTYIYPNTVHLTLFYCKISCPSRSVTVFHCIQQGNLLLTH